MLRSVEWRFLANLNQVASLGLRSALRSFHAHEQRLVEPGDFYDASMKESIAKRAGILQLEVVVVIKSDG